MRRVVEWEPKWIEAWHLTQMFFKPKKRTAPGGERKKVARLVTAVSAAAAVLAVMFMAESWFLPPLAVNQLAELTNTRVKADSVSFSLNGSVVIRGLEIRPIEQTAYDNTILRASKVYVRLGIGSLFLLSPKLKKVSVHNFALDVQEDFDRGKWNIEAIRLAAGKGGGALPALRLKNGRVNYSKISGGKVTTAAGIPINASLKRSGEIRNGYEFELATAKADGRQPSRIVGIYEPGRLALCGSISSEDVPAMQQVWSIGEVTADYQYDKSGEFRLGLHIKDFSTKDRTAAPAILDKPAVLRKVGAASAVAQLFEQYRLTGSGDLDLQAEGNLNDLSETKLDGAISCKDVSILYSVFPYLIEGISGTIDFSESAIKVNNLAGRHNGVNLTIGGGFSDFAGGTKGQVEIRSRNMKLDRDLYEALWPVQKKLWDDFEPNGVVEFDYTLRREPQKRNTYRLDVDLADVNSRYKHFPYPLDNLTGNLFFDHNSIKVTNLNSKKLEHEININGKVIDTDTSQPKFDLVIDVNNVPLDATLANALPLRERNLYNQFNPSGSGRGRILVRNEAADSNKVDFTADLNFGETTLRPPMLGLPITDIKANGIFKPDSIEFKKFDGIYAGQPVSMAGTFEPTEDGKDLTYAMTLGSSDVQIDEELLNLIGQRMRDTVDKLAPSGRIAYTAKLDKQAGVNDIDFEVEVVCRDVTAQPEVLGFALEGITGRISVNRNSVILDNLVSRAADAKAASVRLNGSAEMSSQTNESGEGIVSALVDIDANNFPIEEKRIRTLRARLEYNAQSDKWVADDFAGNFYGGRMTGRIELGAEEGKAASFELQSGFEDADLQKFLADRAKLPDGCGDGSCYSTGRMSGQVNVAGTMNDKASYLGTCRIEITDVRVGKISPIGRLLSLLKLTEPSDYIFDRMFFNAYIKDGRLNFERLQLSGAALTLAGSGWMGLTDKKLELTLAARGPRIAAVEPDVIESLASAIGPGVLQVLVTGNAYEPKIEIKALPVLGDTLELLRTKE